MKLLFSGVFFVYVGIYSMAYKLCCMAPRVQRVGVTMDPELFDEFKKKCEAEGKRSASSQISELVKAYLGNPDVSALEQIFNLKVEIEQIQRRLTTISRLENGEKIVQRLDKEVESLSTRVKELAKVEKKLKACEEFEERLKALERLELKMKSVVDLSEFEKRFDKLEAKVLRRDAELDNFILKLKD